MILLENHIDGTHSQFLCSMTTNLKQINIHSNEKYFLVISLRFCSRARCHFRENIVLSHIGMWVSTSIRTKLISLACIFLCNCAYLEIKCADDLKVEQHWRLNLHDNNRFRSIFCRRGVLIELNFS